VEEIMSMSIQRGICGFVAAVALTSSLPSPGFAQSYYRGYVHKPTVTSRTRNYLYQHPKVKSATVGALVGTAGGAAVGLLSGRGIGRGALIGAGTGAGVGLIRSSEILKRHPIARSTATGTAAGLGLGMIASRSHHAGLKGAAVGGAIGLGFGALGSVLR
jgi:hypothetical protein